MLRFVCQTHNIDLQVDEYEKDFQGRIDEPVIYAHGTGGYSVDFSYMRCPVDVQHMNAKFGDLDAKGATDEERDWVYENLNNLCRHSWVMYATAVERERDICDPITNGDCSSAPILRRKLQ